jgi:S-adenosylmethionine:tRNA ribosyltransferase-isomerase
MYKGKISDFDYQLDDSRIAKYPVERRDESKLLIYNKEQISSDIFTNIDHYLPPNSLLVFNDTKVVQARLICHKSSGAEIEIFCLEPFEPSDYNLAFQKNGSCTWKCLVGNLKKWKVENLHFSTMINSERVNVEVINKEVRNEYCLIEFKWMPAQIAFGEILEQAGKTPIPPYLNRDSEEIDRTRYQTIYSINKGSVAAPTAGLHFTPNVFEKLENKGIKWRALTLHVGAGTFKPVKEEDIANHEMHIEHLYITRNLLENLLNYSGNVTAVGTTTLRTLESIYWMGVKLIDKYDFPFIIDQWDPYKIETEIKVEESINALIQFCEKNDIYQIEGATQLMIVPGYKFKVVQRLITNFHQPKSTLLMLVAAFIGETQWKKVYDCAITNDFRFLSYGDSSLLIP